MDYHKISIVTPSFNQGQYIEQTIKSILSQAGDFHLQYIVSDGGSTDGVVDILKKYDDLLARGEFPINCRGIEFIWWSEPDEGPAQAVNKGYARCTADIIAWIGSDDFYEPGAFAIALETFKNNPTVDFVHGDCIFHHETENLIETRTTTEVDYNGYVVQGLQIFEPATFYTRELFLKTGPIDETVHNAFDYELFARMLKCAHALHVAKPLAHFRLWEKSKSFSQKDIFTAEKKRIHKNLGLPRLAPKKIHRASSGALATWFRLHTPALYSGLKRTLYKISSHITY